MDFCAVRDLARLYHIGTEMLSSDMQSGLLNANLRNTISATSLGLQVFSNMHCFRTVNPDTDVASDRRIRHSYPPFSGISTAILCRFPLINRVRHRESIISIRNRLFPACRVQKRLLLSKLQFAGLNECYDYQSIIVSFRRSKWCQSLVLINLSGQRSAKNEPGICTKRTV